MVIVRNVVDAYRLFADLVHERQEVVSAAFLDGGRRLIKKQEIFRGTVNSSIASPREILRAALIEDAVSLLVAHNHPSQNPEPSQWDRKFTHQLYQACKTVGVPLLDHIIVCKEDYFSFAERRDFGKKGGRRKENGFLSRQGNVFVHS